MTYTLTPTNDYDGNCLLEGPGIKLWLTDFSQEVIDRLNAQAAEIERLHADVGRLLNALRDLHDFAEATHVEKYRQLSLDAFSAAAGLLQELEPPLEATK